MRRMLLFFLAFFAAYRVPLAGAAPLYEDVPVSASMRAMAESIGLSPAIHRARFVPDLVHLVYGPEVRATEMLSMVRVRGRQTPATDPDTITVPIPLTTEIWSRVILRRNVAPADILAAIALDRRAALLCHGLAGLDDETLAFVGDHPAMLTDLYDHVAPAFGAFGSSLHIRDGRVVPPGGAAASPLWEAAVGASVDRPDRFARALYGDSDGRIAYLYDTIAELDAPRAAFALGAWIGDAGARRDRFIALADAVVHGYHEWPLSERPFVRPLNDFAILAMRLRVADSGAPLAPASRAFWNDVFQMSDSASAAAVREEGGRIDAAYLAEASGVADMYVRGDRSDQLSFAQRVFTERDERDKDAALVLKAMPHQRTLLLALDRMGIRRPAVYAALSRQAHEATSADANRTFWLLAQLQGSLALLVRLRTAGTIDAASAERLVLSLAAVPIRDGKYQGAIARWVEQELLALLPPAPTAEARLVAGLSGRSNDASNPRVRWEGQDYSLDFGAATARRIREVRQKQGGVSLDVALDLARLARRPSAPITTGDGHTTARSLAALAENFSERSRNELADTMAPGVDAPGSTRARIDRAVADLERVDERRDSERAARATEPLVDTADTVFGEVLLSIVYALDLGDPDGTPLLGSNVALRHDFGFTLHEGESRARRPWDVPRQDFQPDVPWHVTGSLIGLDLALAPLSLKHIELDRPAMAPHLRSVEREALAVNAALIDRNGLRDSDRAAIVAAIARGRAGVEALTMGDSNVDEIADAIRLDGWRRRALKWTLAHDRADVPGMFSLVELLVLGGGSPSTLDAWGPSAFLSTGCLCTHMPAPGGWRMYEGRPQLAFLSFVVPDLNLRVAALLDDLRLPAALEVPVLSAAIQDLIDEAAPSDANDWLSVAQTAQALTAQRIEDYVAAAAAVDGPLVPVQEEPR